MVANVLYGLLEDFDRNTFKQIIASGNIEKYMQRVSVHKGDVFYVEAGTIHAIGAGILILEVEECSNLTYRIFDYDREDEMGKKRPLHIKKAIEVVNLRQEKKKKSIITILENSPGYVKELLIKCKHFEVVRVTIDTSTYMKTIYYQTKKSTFEIWFCIDGSADIFCGNGRTIVIRKGECLFIPADSIIMTIIGSVQILIISC